MKRLAEERVRQGFTQYRLAKMVGGSTAWIDKLENGDIKAPGYFKIIALADVLGVSDRYISGLENKVAETSTPYGELNPRVRDIIETVIGLGLIDQARVEQFHWIGQAMLEKARREEKKNPQEFKYDVKKRAKKQG